MKGHYSVICLNWIIGIYHKALLIGVKKIIVLLTQIENMQLKNYHL